MSETSQKIEALIFASSKPISEKEIQKRLDLHEDISEVMSNLEDAYQHRGINLKKISKGWIFLTNTEVSDIFHEKREVQKRLSKQAIETLAIVVYHQPITKAEIESIRGVNIGQGIFDQLMELGWIAPGGRKEVPGRPILWGTTDDFLLHFGLGTLDNLPGIEEMKSSGLLNDNFASMNIQELTDDLDKDEAFVEDENDESENLDDFTQSQLTQNNDT
jgi:segregation and condensation protein B|tara:strand:+ start:555 stop:1208 length:654 start_codon:yes stop_codon:yes gene_type:complete